MIGILGGMGPAATADFFTKLVTLTSAQRDQDHPEVVIWSDPTVPDRTEALLGLGPDPTGSLIRGARALAAAGATLLAVPCNTAHAFAPAVARAAGLPLVDMVDEVAQHLQTHHPQIRRIGLLATTGTITAGLYQDRLGRVGIATEVPDPDLQERAVMSAVRAIKAGSSRDRTTAVLLPAVRALVDQGAEALVAGCTEVPLGLATDASPVTLIDPTLILAAAVLRRIGRNAACPAWHDQVAAPSQRDGRPVTVSTARSPTGTGTGTSTSAGAVAVGRPEDEPTPTRSEHDLLGDRDVPADVYWGVHTLRAVENFPVTGTTIGHHPELVRALACVKQAAAQTNRDLGTLEATRAAAIVHACRQLRDGRCADQFVVDVIQGGAGTSTNMNANEVIANLALEHLGHAKGAYQHLHPNEDVNQSQSTNDVYPTALKLATIFATTGLDAALEHLKAAFQAKAVEFAQVVKVGRTQLQDAVPMTLGQEFATYAVMIGEDQLRLREAAEQLHEINLGATAIGTGITAAPGYAALVRHHLAEITDLQLVTAPDLVEATQDCGAFVLFSGALRRIAVKLSKICNDLRLLSSGPRAGLGEINLPPRQAGSSIMPGKVNPVIPEMVNQVAFEVIGNDLTITMAAEAGQLQLNAFEPIIAHSTAKSLAHLEAACRQLADLCVEGITANEAFLRQQVESSIGVVTVLNPYIGYTAATTIATRALRTGRTIPDLAAEMDVLSSDQLHRLLQPESLANLPGHTEDDDHDDSTVAPRDQHRTARPTARHAPPPDQTY